MKMPVLDTGPIDNRDMPRTTRLTIRISNTGRLPAIAGIKAYFVNPAGDGFSNETDYLVRLVSLNPAGQPGSVFTVDNVFANLDVFGVRVITSGQGGSDVAVAISEHGADGQIIEEHVLTGEMAQIKERWFAYVSSEDDGLVTVINTRIPEVVSTISLPGSILRSMDITPDGTRVYVANFDIPSSVFVIGTATNTILANIPMPFVNSQARAIAITPDGSRAYVADFGNDSVSVIDTTANVIFTTIPLPVTGDPIDVAITPDGSRAYVPFLGNPPGVAVIDIATNMVLTTIPFPLNSDPVSVAIAPNGLRAYVSNFSADSISVIDTTMNSVITDIPVTDGNNPFGIAITPDGSRVYAANAGANTVTVINTLTNTILTEIPLPSRGREIAITPDGSRAFVSGTASTQSVFVIDTASNTMVAHLPAGSSPFGIAITPILLF
jgi:YVTN family beta-propeller protein